MRKADGELVSQMLDILYTSDTNGKTENGMEVDGEDVKPSTRDLTIGNPHSLARQRLEAILDSIEAAIDNVNDEYDLKKVKEVDKMLKSCRNPMQDHESAM
jgi:cyclin H